MVAVVFEVVIEEKNRDKYLEIASNIKPALEKIDGFVSVERFQSISNSEKLLSLSFWRDEQAVITWRNMEIHRQAQQQGRDFVFKDYQLRVLSVIRDYGMDVRQQVPKDSAIFFQ